MTPRRSRFRREPGLTTFPRITRRSLARSKVLLPSRCSTSAAAPAAIWSTFDRSGTRPSGSTDPRVSWRWPERPRAAKCCIKTSSVCRWPRRVFTAYSRMHRFSTCQRKSFRACWESFGAHQYSAGCCSARIPEDGTPKDSLASDTAHFTRSRRGASMSPPRDLARSNTITVRQDNPEASSRGSRLSGEKKDLAREATYHSRAYLIAGSNPAVQGGTHMSIKKPASRARQLIGDIAPKLADLTDDVLFGDVWERPQLSKRDRSLITCAALVAMGKTEQMTFHFPRAIEDGVP